MDDFYKSYNDFTKEELAKMPPLDPSRIDKNGYAENVYWNSDGGYWEYLPID